MDTIFVNSENSKTVYSHIALLNLADKVYLQRSKKVLLYQIFAFTILEKT